MVVKKYPSTRWEFVKYELFTAMRYVTDGNPITIEYDAIQQFPMQKHFIMTEINETKRRAEEKEKRGYAVKEIHANLNSLYH